MKKSTKSNKQKNGKGSPVQDFTLHTYQNTTDSTKTTSEMVDNDFLTDANVYYNLPPPLPSVHSRGASLPRGLLPSHHQIARTSSSCPASPKLPPLPSIPLPAIPSSAVFTPVVPPPRPLVIVNHPRVPVTNPPCLPLHPPTSPLSSTAASESTHPTIPNTYTIPPVITPKSSVPPRSPASLKQGNNEATPPPPLLQRAPKLRNLKKLTHTRSIDFDHLYQNLVRVATKPRSNSFSIDLPWRRKKKERENPSQIEEDCREEATSSKSKPQGVNVHKSKSPEDINPPNLPQQLVNRSSSSSSSSSNSGSDLSGEDAVICPGITYVREPAATNTEAETSDGHEMANSWYYRANTLPMGASKKDQPSSAKTESDTAHTTETTAANIPELSEEQRQVLDVNANLDEWLRKERWLEKKRMAQYRRPTGPGGEVDLAILYASDGHRWTQYLTDVFTQLVPKDENARSIIVEMKNVEEIENDIGQLQAVKIKCAKLQIVILSPCFLKHIAKHAKSELGQVFQPEKVLALLLGVENSDLDMPHKSALYSFNDWHQLKIRNMDIGFVYEVLSEGIKILNKCELYSPYQDERDAKFKMTPRKVNGMHQHRVYIIFDEPVDKKGDIKVMLEERKRRSFMVKKLSLINPYTVCFKMPEEFLRGPSILNVTVMVSDQNIGSRQLKCENDMDTLRTILDSISNVTEFMCQALNINPTSDELDQRLSGTVKNHVPLHQLDQRQSINQDGCMFPTWIHFSAYYGLERLTWSLLEVVGGEVALNMPNSEGRTPSVLAYSRGFTALAQALEDAALLSSLAAQSTYVPLSHETKREAAEPCEETYNRPPPPRPLPRRQKSLYDVVPSPREVSTGMEYIATCSPTPPPPPLTPPPSTLLPRVVDSDLPPPPSPDSLKICALSSSQSSHSVPTSSDNAYIDMNASSGCSGEKEYSPEVYTLITAWMERSDTKEFIETHQDKIAEIKNQMETGTVKEHTLEIEDLGGDAEVESGREETVADDEGRQKTIVEQFFSLLRGPRKANSHPELERTRPPCDSPNDYIDDPSRPNKTETSSENDDGEACDNPPVTILRHRSEPACPIFNKSMKEKDKLKKKASYPEKVSSSRVSVLERPLLPPPRPSSNNNYIPNSELHTPRQFEMQFMQSLHSQKSIVHN